MITTHFESLAERIDVCMRIDICPSIIAVYMDFTEYAIVWLPRVCSMAPCGCSFFFGANCGRDSIKPSRYRVIERVIFRNNGIQTATRSLMQERCIVARHAFHYKNFLYFF